MKIAKGWNFRWVEKSYLFWLKSRHFAFLHGLGGILTRRNSKYVQQSENISGTSHKIELSAFQFGAFVSIQVWNRFKKRPSIMLETFNLINFCCAKWFIILGSIVEELHNSINLFFSSKWRATNIQKFSWTSFLRYQKKL